MKTDLLDRLKGSRDILDKIIAGLESLDTDSSAELNITFGMFEFIDTIGKIEVDIYNYLKERRSK